MTLADIWEEQDQKTAEANRGLQPLTEQEYIQDEIDALTYRYNRLMKNDVKRAREVEEKLANLTQEYKEAVAEFGVDDPRSKKLKKKAQDLMKNKREKASDLRELKGRIERLEALLQ
ncbi:hypothetical protein [Nesterenkonia alba]|uniref:hypothetical protein n=1 Tax=Nesterenkonia alba TaxID=515814 RepID=UPI0003B47C1D|nr:hypothetical protein [Nesterenkonia alba]